MRVRKARGLLALGVLLSLFAVTMPTLFAQVTTTNMVGTVTDSSGAAVAGAQVALTNTGTNQVRTTQTNAQGDYRLEFLPTGNYNVEISAPNFKKVVRSGIVLHGADPARADPRRASRREEGVGHLSPPRGGVCRRCHHGARLRRASFRRGRVALRERRAAALGRETRLPRAD